MKKLNYFDFLRGEKVTIRKILERELTSEAAYFTVALNETDEHVNIGVPLESADNVKPGATLFYKACARGYAKWKNGTVPLGILP